MKSKVLNNVPPLMAIVIGSLLLILAIRHGIGIDHDSMQYYVSATRRGVHTLPVHQPPLFHILCRLAHIANIQLTTFSLFVNITALVATILLTNRLLSISDMRNGWRALLLIWIVVHPLTLATFSYMQSEPLFLLMQMLFLVFLYNWITEKRNVQFVGCYIFALLAFYTRYVGASAIALLGCILIREWMKRKNHVRSIVSLSLLAFGVFVLWSWNYYRRGTVTGLSVNFYPISSAQMEETVYSALQYLLPWKAVVLLKAEIWLFLITILVCVCVIRTVLKPKSRDPILIFIAYIIFYLLIIVLTRLFVAADYISQPRYYAPLLPVLALCIAFWGDGTLNGGKLQVRQMLVGACILGLMAISAIQSGKYVIKAYEKGLGFNSTAWKTSEAIKFIRFVDKRHRIYSNCGAPAFFHYGQYIEGIPEKYDRSSLVQKIGYEKALHSLHEQSVQDGSMVLISRVIHPDDDEFPPYLPTVFDLIQLSKLEKVLELSDATILAAADGNGQIANSELRALLGEYMDKRDKIVKQ